MALVVLYPLPKRLDIVGKCLRFYASAGVQLLGLLGNFFDFPFKLLKLLKVLLLDLGVLDFDYVEFFFVFLGAFPESTSELLCFLCIERLVIGSVYIFLLDYGIHLLLESLIFDLRKFNLVIQSRPRVANLMLIVEVVL